MAEGVVDTANRVFRCTVRMRCRQAAMQTSFHVRDVALPNASVQSIHAEVKPWVFGAFRTAISSDISLEKFEVQRLIENSYFAEDYVNTVGGNSNAQGSTMFAASVALKSNLRSRHANGRMFWPAAGVAGGDQIAGGTFNVLAAAAADLMTRFGGVIIIGEAKLVVVGAPEPGGTPESPNAPRWTDVEAVRVNPLLTALHSRKSGVGS